MRNGERKREDVCDCESEEEREREWETVSGRIVNAKKKWKQDKWKSKTIPYLSLRLVEKRYCKSLSSLLNIVTPYAMTWHC